MPLWDDLPADARDRADAHIRQGHFLPALTALRTACPPPGMGLAEARELVHARRAVLVPPPGADDDPLDVDSLAALASALEEPVLAVEAVWAEDGAHGCHLELRAVLGTPPRTARLATVHTRPGLPYESTRARRAGRALAHHLGVVFSFPHPSGPAPSAPPPFEPPPPAPP
ncbi:hypothetical protein, partial [Streptomyces sp. NRRL S-575]|uniref:hypothetical protein n=1 Tax=Streptomyces sp. NRRL S-575 TaxID=1463915 RepID=UPI00099C656F